ncbi:MAG: AAA family ATPase, partial [Acidimicrobiales bacterium]
MAVPPGLVGIYGPNGAGKSTLLEAVLFTLWGKARTSKEEVRSSGTTADCVTEVGFEHEGHEYVVRRSLSGINSAVRAEVSCDGTAVADGARDTGRYMHQVLGLDDVAFRASVFAEQKQLAAFSQQAPSERRRLVLELLGITPLDSARDAARRDAKVARDSHQALKAALPDFDLLQTEAEDAAAHAGATAVASAEAEGAARAVVERASLAAAEASRHVELRQRYDLLVVEGKGARRELDSAQKLASELEVELAALAEAEAELARMRPAVGAVAQAEERAEMVGQVAGCVGALLVLPVGNEPPLPNASALEVASEAEQAAREGLTAATGRRGVLAEEHTRASDRAARSATLSGEEDCPLCGQALGDAFGAVRAHHLSDVAAAAARLASAEAEMRVRKASASEASGRLLETRRRVEAGRAARDAWETAVAKSAEARRDAQKLATELSDRHGAGPDWNGGEWPGLDDPEGWQAASA